MGYLRAFVAGFLATLIFHQGLVALLHVAGVIPFAPYDLASTWPLGVPKVVSLAFWGGVWGVVLWPLVRRARGAGYWLRWLVAGAVGPTLVGLVVVLPLKGIPVGPASVVIGLLVNGVWGLGTGLLAPPLRRVLPAG